MNLRLRPDTEAALRAEAERSGRSQQDILREAVDRHLGLIPAQAAATSQGSLVARGTVRPPRTPYRKVEPAKRLPDGVTTLDLLDRGDRV